MSWNSLVIRIVYRVLIMTLPEDVISVGDGPADWAGVIPWMRNSTHKEFLLKTMTHSVGFERKHFSYVIKVNCFASLCVTPGSAPLNYHNLARIVLITQQLLLIVLVYLKQNLLTPLSLSSLPAVLPGQDFPALLLITSFQLNHCSCLPPSAAFLQFSIKGHLFSPVLICI